MASVPDATPQPHAIRRYNNVAVAIHWLSAALILFQIWLGFNFRGSAPELQLFNWHKTIGVTILSLSLFRLFWRRTNPPPPYPEGFPKWERLAGVWNHRLFYLALIALPLTGLIAISTSKRATGPFTDLVGGIPFPLIPGLPKSWHDPSEGVHEFLVFATLALLALHIGAALKHQFADRFRMSGRMPPFRVKDTPTIEG